MDVELKLVKKVATGQRDEYGDEVYKELHTTIFAEKIGISQTEFYQSMNSGLKPEIRFKIYDLMAYDNEEELIFEDYRYKILRVYRSDEYLELTCYGGVYERPEIGD